MPRPLYFYLMIISAVFDDNSISDYVYPCLGINIYHQLRGKFEFRPFVSVFLPNLGPRGRSTADKRGHLAMEQFKHPSVLHTNITQRSLSVSLFVCTLYVAGSNIYRARMQSGTGYDLRTETGVGSSKHFSAKRDLK